MYAYARVCEYACIWCMYVCMGVCVYACVHVSMYACLHVYRCKRTEVVKRKTCPQKFGEASVTGMTRGKNNISKKNHVLKPVFFNLGVADHGEAPRNTPWKSDMFPSLNVTLF